MEFYDRKEERTGVQEASDYNRRIDVQCDFVMVYGFHNLKNRIKPWKKQGYVIHLMTGVSWGGYQDYLYGKFDGIDHHDEGQLKRDGSEMNHGVDIPYMVPSISFSKYLAQKLKAAVDAGVEAIHLEEPEFWVETGYSEAFKREWQIYYKEPWQDPQATAEGQYRASKLKQYLYTRTLDRLCAELKEYAMVKYGRLLRFYVPTHSLINYSQWKIVSPESALVDLPSIDGYIAQIWTGTSRTANVFNGITKERTFETAFLEYGIMQELVRGTGRRMWFLHDPIEDNPGYCWKDYRSDYYRTVTASLLHPAISDYEVCPWPNRVMNGKYPTEDKTGTEDIPAEYETNLLTVMHTLRQLKNTEAKWISGEKQVGLLLADSCMFQRIYPDGDPEFNESRTVKWSPFYGLALPLLKYGLCVRPVQLDNIRRFAGYLDAYDTLVLSYEYMKPESPDINAALANWVRGGGTLIYAGDGSDCFHDIRHWWNAGENDYKNPAEHLFESLGLERKPADGIYNVGNGRILVINKHPKNFAVSADESTAYRAKVKEVLAQSGYNWEDSNAMILKRGSYVVTAVMDETTNKDFTLDGTYVDLYSTNLCIEKNPVLKPGSVGLFYDLSSIDKTTACDVIAVSGRITDAKFTARSMKFKFIGPEKMTAAMRIYTKRPVKNVTAVCGGKEIPVDIIPNSETNTSLLTFESSPDKVSITVNF